LSTTYQLGKLVERVFRAPVHPLVQDAMAEASRSYLSTNPLVVEEYYRFLLHLIRRLNVLLKGMAEEVVYRFHAYTGGEEEAKFVSVSCGRSTCGTCMGTEPLHFPYFYVGRVLIKMRELPDFLSQLGLGDDWQQRFFTAMEARHALIRIVNLEPKFLRYIGVEI